MPRPRILASAVAAAALASSLAAASPALAAGTPLGPAVATVAAGTAMTAPSCVTPASRDEAEAPCNPHLADSAWAGNHRNSYAQASSPFPGPVGPAERVNVDHVSATGVPVIVSFSPAYPDGGHALWASTVGFSREILKVDAGTLALIDRYVAPVEEGSAPSRPSVSGAYNLVDADNRLIVGTATAIEVYGDALPAVRASSIVLLRRFELPAAALCGEDDALVGINMTYDGHIAFATKNGIIGTLPRDPALMGQDTLTTMSLNGDDCAAGAQDGSLETISNSIAVDEQGGIYPVTSDAMYRIDWDGSALTVAWRAPYAGAGNAGAGRIGPGSGSTPSLMGTAPDDDRFVVITDGQELMHLVLLWRDEIPADWEPVRDGADRRIACEVPVTFGDPEATTSLSEQSVLVRGDSAVVVNDLQPLSPVTDQLPAQFSIYTVFFQGPPGTEPRGAEKFSWDPVTRTCGTDWANPDVALPNGIPTMSAETGLMYAIGLRDGTWTLEGIEFDTGEVVLTVPTTSSPTGNSAYAATTIGPDGTVWTGTLGGITRFSPCGLDVDEVCGRRLRPDQALLGDPPYDDPEALLRYVFGLPNDDPGAAGDAGDTREGGVAAARAPGDGSVTAMDAGRLPATGGGAALVGALTVGIAGALRRQAG